MDQEQRKRGRPLPLDVPEVEVDTIHLAQELRVPVQMAFVQAPVITGAPVVAEFTDIGDISTVRPAGAGDQPQPENPAAANAAPRRDLGQYVADISLGPGDQLFRGDGPPGGEADYPAE